MRILCGTIKTGQWAKIQEHRTIDTLGCKLSDTFGAEIDAITAVVTTVSSIWRVGWAHYVDTETMCCIIIGLVAKQRMSGGHFFKIIYALRVRHHGFSDLGKVSFGVTPVYIMQTLMWPVVRMKHLWESSHREVKSSNPIDEIRTTYLYAISIRCCVMIIN